MTFASKLSHLLLAIALAGCLALGIARKAKQTGTSSTTQTRPAAQQSAKSQAGLTTQRQEANQRGLPEVGKERNKEAQRAQSTLDKEAFSVIADTRMAIDAIAANQKSKAMDAIESATGKINILLARYPAAALIPVEMEVDIIDTASNNDKAIKQLISQANTATAQHHLPAARLLLYDLMSEIRLRTYNLPLATYPDALKNTARLLDQQKKSQASAELVTAVNTLVIIDQSTPIPLIWRGRHRRCAEGASDRQKRGADPAQDCTKRATALRPARLWRRQSRICFAQERNCESAEAVARNS
jgi:YfdX protein